MKFLNLTIEDFGVYGGRFEFDLTPNSVDQFDRPIILFNGLNGVGKTTLVEAIRLCLHGSLVIGKRVGRSEYEHYLSTRLYRNNGKSSKKATIEISFEYIDDGKPKVYRVIRNWDLFENKLQEEISILENGERIKWIKSGTEDLFLRELIPPMAFDLFILDGENLDIITNELSNPLNLSSTFREFFGLNMSEQLSQDLDTYISRQNSESEITKTYNQVQDLHKNREKLQRKKTEILTQLQNVKATISDYESYIQKKEQEISNKGGNFVQEFPALREKENELLYQLEESKKEIQEMFSGLLPFSIAKRILEDVLSRLKKEKAYKNNKIAQQVVDEQRENLQRLATNEELWEKLGAPFALFKKESFLESLGDFLSETYQNNDLSEADVFIHASEKDAEIMTAWINQAVFSIPMQFSRLMSNHNSLEDELQTTRSKLVMVPPEVQIAPLFEELKTLNDELQKLEKIQNDLSEQISKIDYELETIESSIQRMRESIHESKHVNKKVKLASDTQVLLSDYSKLILREKLSLFEKNFTSRFNSLCRKNSMIDSIMVDPDTYMISLKRGSQEVFYKDFSAGEMQLFSVAFVWTMYDISGLSFPIVFDTPLSRLDTEHRQKMLTEFFPKANHQMLLLATDAEIDQEILEELSPTISHGYYLEFDEVKNTTTARRIELWN